MRGFVKGRARCCRSSSPKHVNLVNCDAIVVTVNCARWDIGYIEVVTGKAVTRINRAFDSSSPTRKCKWVTILYYREIVEMNHAVYDWWEGTAQNKYFATCVIV